MQQRTWDTLDDRLRLVVRKASTDRFWTGFDARVYDVTPGFTDTTTLSTHNLTMLIGRPLHTVCLCDGMVSRRFQRPGDIDIVPAGSSAAWQDTGVTTFIDVNISPSLMKTAAEGLNLDVDRVAVNPHLQLQDPQMQHVFWALKGELESPNPVGRLYADSLGLALAAQLLQRFATVDPNRWTAALSRRRLKLVLDYIEEHIALDLTIDELARVTDTSPSHFKVLFKNSVGMPVHQYVIRKRAEYAMDLMVRTRRPLSQIALQAGFSSQSHMSLWVRRITGLTPKEVRKTR
jgi:AraC family transcriptional regulator